MKYKTEAAQAAQLIRADLKQAYPDLKSRVNSSTFAGGDEVRVTLLVEDIEHYITWQTVKDFLSKYEAGSFDGMNDLYTYDNLREDIPQVKWLFVDVEVVAGVMQRLVEAYNQQRGEKAWVQVGNSYHFNGVQVGNFTCEDHNQAYWFNKFVDEYLKLNLN